MKFSKPKVDKFYFIYDRITTYRDFTLNLLYYLVDFYIDYESLSSDKDIKNHFNYFFNKSANEFKKEGIDFIENNVLREYFNKFYYLQFYKNQNDNTVEEQKEFFEDFWCGVFKIEDNKNKNELKILIELYSIFDKSLI